MVRCHSGLAQPTSLELPQTQPTHAGLQTLDSRLHPSESRIQQAGATWGDRAVRAIKGSVFVSNHTGHLVPDTSGPGRSHADQMYRDMQNKNAVPAMGAC